MSFCQTNGRNKFGNFGNKYLLQMSQMCGITEIIPCVVYYFLNATCSKMPFQKGVKLIELINIK